LGIVPIAVPVVVDQDDQLLRHSPIVPALPRDRLAGRPDADPRCGGDRGADPTGRAEWAAWTASARGLVFDVRDGGPPDGEPVVLLHGFPQDSTAFDRMAPALHSAGLRTLAPDQRGYSPGARPVGRSHYRLRELTVDDVLALLDAAGLEQRARRRARLGRRGGLGAGRLAPRPGAHADRAVGAAPGGDAAGDGCTSDQALRSWYMGFFQLPVAARAAAAGRRRRGAAPDAAQRRAAAGAGRPLRRADAGARTRSPPR
jgi:pimeloyl-ACP methyl ester carboxylesterase